jgi:8-oxo-dGTP pyrophosphatase MutT (NUDIX family)
MLTYYELIAKVDSVPYAHEEEHAETVGQCYDFVAHDGVTVIGRILPLVMPHLANFPALIVNHNQRLVRISPFLDSLEKRSKAMEQICRHWRQKKVFKALEGWRDELYTVFNPSHMPYLLMERAASCLFGIVTYGVHITGYIPATEDSPIKIWVPRRSPTKPTYPGMLDNTVAGGLGYPHGLFETVLKECEEEAGLDAEYVSEHIRPAGVVTYWHQAERVIADEIGVYQPEVEYIYDLIMDPGVVPKPVDGEVAEFYLLTVEEVKVELTAGNFKYNCALVMIDFLIRQGFIDPEDEPDYVEIVRRCHRDLQYPLR